MRRRWRICHIVWLGHDLVGSGQHVSGTGRCQALKEWRSRLVAHLVAAFKRRTVLVMSEIDFGVAESVFVGDVGAESNRQGHREHECGPEVLQHTMSVRNNN